MMLRWLLQRLRWPQAREIVGGGIVVALLGLAFSAGQHSGPVAVQEVRGPLVVETVTVAAIAKQEPPVKPGLLDRVTHASVTPTRVQVAPGAGRELLAAVCDTTARFLKADSFPAEKQGEFTKQTPPDMPPAGVPRVDHADQKEPAPALVYAWEVKDGWSPLGRSHVRLFAVGRQGETVTDYRVRLPAEGRQVPQIVVRESRLPVKRIVWLGGAVAVGWVAHSLASQF